ncbi:MAG TPA: SpoIIE family protein phosphatase [Polyangiaceae bacterium]|nr:SpoIIE family protein phosphatase [Polyangiaceae bacterium]
MAAAHKNPNLTKFPFLHGMLRANGETVEGPRPSDWFDVFVDDRANLVVALLDAHSSAESPQSFLAGLMQSAKAGLQRHAPLHAVVSELEMQLAVHPGAELGLLILRVSQQDAKVELLNAGMPTVVNTSPGGRLDFYPAQSSAVGRRVGEVHPYELIPLRWGGSWLAVSDGMVNGSLSEDGVAALCQKLDLVNRGALLAQASTEDLYDAFQDALSTARFLRDDATGIVVNADAGARFRSGIV